MKNNRHSKIIELVHQYAIETQEELAQKLNEAGFEVTQATLSRDLKLLKVGKISDGRNGYVYTLPGEDERQETDQSLAQDFMRGYISIEYSGNIAVVKTYSGYADVVAVALDTLAMDEILGTIAGGDNCVFACLKEGITGEDFLKALKTRIPELEE